MDDFDRRSSCRDDVYRIYYVSLDSHQNRENSEYCATSAVDISSKMLTFAFTQPGCYPCLLMRSAFLTCPVIDGG
jgi:hypothetical protein